MRDSWCAVVAGHWVAAFLLVGIAVPVAQAQQAAPTPAAIPALAPAAAPAPTSVPAPRVDLAGEAAALQALSQQFQTRRSELEVRRRALMEERTRISSLDRPASDEQVALWHERDAMGQRLKQRVAMLEGLVAALTPQSLQAISAPGDKKYEFFTTDVGLKSTALEVSLRDMPDGPVVIVLPQDSLVVQVAADSSGSWSVVVASGGAGYVPTSMLKSAD